MNIRLISRRSGVVRPIDPSPDCPVAVAAMVVQEFSAKESAKRDLGSRRLNRLCTEEVGQRPCWFAQSAPCYGVQTLPPGLLTRRPMALLWISTFSRRGPPFSFPAMSVRPKPGLSGSIIRMLGIGAKPKRRLARVDQIPCPFAFAIVPGSQAESALDDLVRLKPDCSPVILGTPEAAASMFENASHPAPIESLLVELDRFDLDGWLAERFAELKRVQIEPPRGPWPSAPRRTADDQLSSVRVVLGARNFLPEVVIALAPSAEPALAALHLGYGDWNDCPSPIIHVPWPGAGRANTERCRWPLQGMSSNFASCIRSPRASRRSRSHSSISLFVPTVCCRERKRSNG